MNKGMITYVARYRRKDGILFSLYGNNIVSETSDILDNIPMFEVEDLARNATPHGYDFIEVKARDEVEAAENQIG